MLTQIILVLFGLQSLSAHTIAKIELRNGTEVYKVKELANDTVEFINPKADKPTLREIIYYNVVEKPYIEEESNTIQVEKFKENPLDFDETTRPFTNSHGYQFIDWGEIENEHQKKDEEESNNDDKLEDSTIEEFIPHPEDDKDLADYNSDEDKLDRNYDENDSNENVRRRREIYYKNIPEAPTLPDMDINAFPDYIQRMLANRQYFEKNKERSIISNNEMGTPKINVHSNNQRRTYGMHMNNGQGYSWNHIDKKNKPTHGFNHYDSSRSYQSQLKNHTKNIPNKKATYTGPVTLGGKESGINKEVIRGSLENKIENITKTKAKYDEKRNTLENKEILGINDSLENDITNKLEDMVTDVNKSITSLNIKEPRTHEAHVKDDKREIKNVISLLRKDPQGNEIFISKENTDEEEFVNKIRKSFEEILKKFPTTEETNVKTIEPPKTYGMNLTGDHGYIWNDLNKPGVHYNVGETVASDVNINNNAQINNPLSAEDNFESTSVIPTTISPNTSEVTDGDEVEKESIEGQNVSLEISENTETTTKWSDETTDIPNIDNESEESVEKDDGNSFHNLTLTELIQKEEFWEGLTKWTASFIDILNEYIKDVVKDEVAKQLENSCAKPVTEENVNKEDNEAEKEQIDNEKSDHKEKDPEQNKVSSNLDSKVEKVDGNKAFNISADTIYGNVAGNDHVTNFFIFYPNEKVNKTIKSIINNKESITSTIKPVESHEGIDISISNNHDINSNIDTDKDEIQKGEDISEKTTSSPAIGTSTSAIETQEPSIETSSNEENDTEASVESNAGNEEDSTTISTNKETTESEKTSNNDTSEINDPVSTEDTKSTESSETTTADGNEINATTLSDDVSESITEKNNSEENTEPKSSEEKDTADELPDSDKASDSTETP